MTATRRLEAAEIREEWLGHALSTQPADRPAAEAAITELYRLAERDAPVFVWVRSPAEAVPHIPPAPRLSASSESSKCRDWPLASVLASLQTQLRERLDGRIGLPRQRTFRLRTEVDDPPLPTRPRDVVLAEVTQPLRQTVLDSLVGPVRLAHRPLTGDSRGLVWHGQHDAYWVGHYDAFRRCLGVRYPSRDEMQLGLWAAVARSCGWWWPSETMCVISERPVEVHTEAAGDEGQLRLHTSEGLRCVSPTAGPFSPVRVRAAPSWSRTRTGRRGQGISERARTSTPTADIILV